MAFISNKGNKNLDTYDKKTINEIYEKAEHQEIETKIFYILA